MADRMMADRMKTPVDNLHDEHKMSIRLDCFNGSSGNHRKGASEGTHLITKEKYNPETIKLLQKLALALSWASVIFSLVSGVIGIVLSIRGNSESLFAYGLDAVLDSMSSIAVVWRFYGPDYCSDERERRACIVIGFAFLVSSMSLIGRSTHSILMETHESKQVVLYERFATVCAVGSILLATAKLILGHKLSSKSLSNDSIITYVGAASCVAGVVGLEIYVNDSDYWYLDSVFGIVLGCFLLGFGIRLLITTFKEGQ